MKISSVDENSPFLTLVGVGPGDPSLLTLAAVQAIQNSNLIAFPVSKLGAESMAAAIASEWITEEKTKLPLVFPMITDLEKLRLSWESATDQLVDAVLGGDMVTFLCQGDVSLFGSASYLIQDMKVRYPDFFVRVVPGINSFSAAAASAHIPLCMQKDQLLISPTPENEMVLENLLNDAASSRRTIVLLKIGLRWRWVRPLLIKMNLLKNSILAKRVGFLDEQVINAELVNEDTLPYFSLLIIRQSFY